MERLTPDDPSQVGGYPLLGILGEGGMGRVYLAQSPGGRALALKTIRSELTSDPGFRSRFEREIRNSDRVRSSWTVPVVDWSRSPEGRQWLATEYVPAPSLLDWTEQHGLISHELLPLLARELSRALAVVAETGLVHRDLKPSNVLLGPQHPLLIDFGIAHAGDDARFTTTGGVIGSPGYLSPEQASGEEDITPASDVFALAALLHHAATGHGPFLRPGESPSVPTLLYRVVHHDPDLSGLPSDVREALTDAFAKDPADRPSPAALADRFGRILRGPARWQEGLPADLRADHERREAAVTAASRAAAAPGPPSGGFVTQGSFGPPIAPAPPAPRPQGPPPGLHPSHGPHTPPTSYPGQALGPYRAPGTPPPGALGRGPGGTGPGSGSGSSDDDRPWLGIARRSCIAVLAIGVGIVLLIVMVYIAAMDTGDPGDLDDRSGTSTGAEKRGPEDETSPTTGGDQADTVADDGADDGADDEAGGDGDEGADDEAGGDGDEGADDEAGGDGDEGKGDEADDPVVAMPHRWTGEWRGVDFQIAVWLEDGQLGETIGRFESVHDDSRTGQEYRCRDTLELADVSEHETELYLVPVRTERVGPADVSANCAVHQEYVADVHGDHPDELRLHVVPEHEEYDPSADEARAFALARQ